ncbi:hypothetical protein [Aequorivita sp. KMM 9714]|uniref:hypothetical protein n=1 Tax=Aequorivita sp. KMM 9714 TaxID=2707173 RepID=UPI0013EBE099|nr:hypothetical protein [Aequorivita sp. KMM 9714]NGX84163.1 hypothetical protein [Aequorivita sp. KMM 9714]
MNNRIVLTAILAYFISVSAFSQVGINNTNPTTTLDVNGGISLRESVAPLKINDGVSENIDLGEVPYSQYLIEGPTGAFSIKSIKPISGADGQIVRLINSTGYDMTIVNDKMANSLGILCPNESNLNLKGKNSSVTLQYSKSLRNWTVLGYASKQGMRKIDAIGKSNIHRQNSSWDTFDELDIEITPSSPLIYLNFNATGRRDFSASAKFRILVNGDPIPGLEIRASNSGGSYNASLPMYPLEVTPGEKIKFSVQWFREGIGASAIYNHPSSNQSHNRYLTIID